MRIELPPPTPSKPSRKVIDLARARQERRPKSLSGATKRYALEAYSIDTPNYRASLCENGRVYFEPRENDAAAAQIDLSQDELRNMISDLSKLLMAQRRHNERLRGAHLWIARPHPIRKEWLLVRHKDQDTPFKPVKVGKHWRTTKTGERQELHPGFCSACKKEFVVGEKAFQALRCIVGVVNGPPRICQGCTRPQRTGMFEVIPDGELETTNDHP